MKKILETILNRFKNTTSETPEAKDYSNTEIVNIYNKMKSEWKLTPVDEPNYTLARKVFLDFNDFNQKNLDIHLMYLDFIPLSLLPYPKNYIKCAYYIFLESLKKEKNLEMFKVAQEVSSTLFLYYPNWEKYQENLKHKAWYDDVVFKNGNPFNGRIPREEFKKLYGTYQISKEEYDNSPSSTDATNEKLIHDFGVLPEIEEDVDYAKILKDKKPSV
jgi:hypothetical protein